VNFLITGATGFLGPHLIKKLIAEGHTCRCLVRPGNENKLPSIDSIEIVTGDITIPETLIGIGKNMDCLIHMATLGHMSNFTAPESLFYATNVQGTINIMTEALRAGIKKIVHCSSTAAMGICDEIPSTENSPCKPHHNYGRTKLQSEKEVRQMVSEKGLPAVIVRFSMIYGPGEPRDILKLARLANRGLFPKLGNRSKLTPLIHVDDAIQGLLLAIENGTPGEIYLITNHYPEPFDHIREIIKHALDSKKPDIYVPEWAALILAIFIEKLFFLFGKNPPVSRKNIESTLADRVFSIEKAIRELDFNPKIDPAIGLRETILWYKENGWI
jgi:dihydroflavonol-4-reductase